jgi:hypothetical protein
MSSALAHAAVGKQFRDVADRPMRPRILIVHSCRIAQLLTAVVLARKKHRDAEVVVLSHRGHRHLLRAAGADRVVEVGGRRFGLLRTAPWALKRLRDEGFAEVVIPQLHSNGADYVSLYQMIATLRPSRVTIVPGDEQPETFEGARFIHHALHHTCTSWHTSVVARMLLTFLK